jgi:hypothetical protein
MARARDRDDTVRIVGAVLLVLLYRNDAIASPAE